MYLNCSKCGKNLEQHKNLKGGFVQGKYAEAWVVLECPKCSRFYKYSEMLVEVEKDTVKGIQRNLTKELKICKF